MPVESAAYLSDLNPAYPEAGDPMGQGYQHIDLIKSVLKNTFPNVNGAVTGTPAQLNTAAAAFSGTGPTALPQTGTAGAALAFTPVSGAATPQLQAVNGGLTATSSTTANGTTTTVNEWSTDGKGNLTATTSLTAPTVNASTVVQQAGAALVPKGVIVLWSGAVNAVPAGWALCDGTNGTPDLRDKFLVGAGNTYAAGAAGGAASVTLATANLPAHNHGVTDPGHGHSLALSDPGHGHGHGVSDPGHGHGVSDPGHIHAHAVEMGAAGFGYMGTGSTQWSGGGAGSVGNNGTPFPTSRDATGISINGAATGISIWVNNSGTGITGSANGNTTGITTNNTGSGTAFDNRPPYYALAFIMKL